MSELDRTQMRILGALIEKELAVPESYPMTEAVLVAACNQKSNRDPEMSLEVFEVQGALNSMMGSDWAKTMTTTGSRVTRYGHRLESHHVVDKKEKAVLCELLVRGPQAPGALKSRVTRLGFSASSPAEIEAALRSLAGRSAPVVEQLPRRPRERDHRWRHLLGAMDDGYVAAAQVDEGHEIGSRDVPAESVGLPSNAAGADDANLERRVELLEEAVLELREALERLGQ